MNDKEKNALLDTLSILGKHIFNHISTSEMLSEKEKAFLELELQESLQHLCDVLFESN